MGCWSGEETLELIVPRELTQYEFHKALALMGWEDIEEEFDDLGADEKWISARHPKYPLHTPHTVKFKSHMITAASFLSRLNFLDCTVGQGKKEHEHPIYNERYNSFAEYKQKSLEKALANWEKCKDFIYKLLEEGR